MQLYKNKSLFICLFASISFVGFAQHYEGDLSADDIQITSGENHDVYYFTATAGQRVTILMQSAEIDPYVIIHTPAGYTYDNDNADDSESTMANFIFIAEETGKHKVLATSASPNQLGTYQIDIDVTDIQISSTEDCSGELADGDSRLENDELYDTYYFRATAGRRINAQLKSDQFDTYIILVSPTDEIYENDDFGHNKDNSFLSVIPEESGEWRMIVTSYEGGEQGTYQASLSYEGSVSAGGANAKISSTMIPSEIHEGDLGLGDPKLKSGELYDLYYVTVQAGESITASLKSDDFDTYLILRTPSGESVVQNDDFNNSKNQSFIHFDATEAGEWAIMVTSYEASETGNYHLEISGGDPKISANE